MCIAVWGWLVFLSNKILLMVIGSCFNHFTPNRGVISVLFLISGGNLIRVLFYSLLIFTFPTNFISKLFTSWCLSFNGRMSSVLYRVRLLGMMVTGEPQNVDDKFLFFSVLFCFDAVVVVVVLYFLLIGLIWRFFRIHVFRCRLLLCPLGSWFFL